MITNTRFFLERLKQNFLVSQSSTTGRWLFTFSVTWILRLETACRFAYELVGVILQQVNILELFYFKWTFWSYSSASDWTLPSCEKHHWTLPRIGPSPSKKLSTVWRLVAFLLVFLIYVLVVVWLRYFITINLNLVFWYLVVRYLFICYCKTHRLATFVPLCCHKFSPARVILVSRFYLLCC